MGIGQGGPNTQSLPAPATPCPPEMQTRKKVGQGRKQKSQPLKLILLLTGSRPSLIDQGWRLGRAPQPPPPPSPGLSLYWLGVPPRYSLLGLDRPLPCKKNMPDTKQGLPAPAAAEPVPSAAAASRRAWQPCSSVLNGLSGAGPAGWTVDGS